MRLTSHPRHSRGSISTSGFFRHQVKFSTVISIVDEISIEMSSSTIFLALLFTLLNRHCPVPCPCWVRPIKEEQTLKIFMMARMFLCGFRLMADQVQSLREKGVDALIFSSEGREDRVGTGLLASEETLASGSLIFSFPEALIQDKWRDLLCCFRLCVTCSLIPRPFTCALHAGREKRTWYTPFAHAPN